MNSVIITIISLDECAHAKITVFHWQSPQRDRVQGEGSLNQGHSGDPHASEISRNYYLNTYMYMYARRW